MYAPLLQDGSSRRILGFTVAASTAVELVTCTLYRAVNARRRSNVDFVVEGAIAHSDAGSQYTSLAFAERPLGLGIADNVGHVGTAYDIALMESTIGLYEIELVHRRATGWRGREELELATARRVAWFIRDRLCEKTGYFTPIEIVAAYVHQQGLARQAA